jgi:hypothetical protein
VLIQAREREEASVRGWREVDPLVWTTRLTKALMDGGSGLNLMYLNTFEGMGLT